MKLDAASGEERLQEAPMQVRRLRKPGVVAGAVPVVVGAGAEPEADVGAVRDQRQPGNVAALVLARQVFGRQLIRAGGRRKQR
jgi:hypothetical protein